MIPDSVTTYPERAIAYSKAQGRKNGQLLVIDKNRDRQQWRAWRQYLEDIGFSTTIIGNMRRSQTWTVPADWPWEFDENYPKPYSHMKGGN